MASNVFVDKSCSMPCSSDIDPFATSFAKLRESSKGDSLWYKTEDKDSECHKITFSGLGFHLGHEDKFHECEKESSTIVSCILGEASARISARNKEQGVEKMAFYNAVEKSTP